MALRDISHKNFSTSIEEDKAQQDYLSDLTHREVAATQCRPQTPIAASPTVGG